MTLALYADVHIPQAIVEGLRLRGVDVIRAQEDHMAEETDRVLLTRATALHRILVTSDHHLLVEASRRQRQRVRFAGIIFVHALRVSIGKGVEDLEIIAKIAEPSDVTDQVLYLPFY